MFFFLKMLWFFLNLPVLLQRWCFTCHLVVQAWSPAYTPRKNPERPESRIYFKIFEKTQYLMNTLYLMLIRDVDHLKRSCKHRIWVNPSNIKAGYLFIRLKWPILLQPTLPMQYFSIINFLPLSFSQNFPLWNIFFRPLLSELRF